ncbi:MAG TPA: 2-oxo acid dehydrogenase subunit E2 [Phycicoccus sp.]
MAFGRRRDGVLVEDLPALRRIIPYLLRTRTSSSVYFPQRIDVEDLLAWLDEVNAGRPDAEHVTLFHVLVTAVGRTLRLRPELNRFVAGRRTYQHRDISISFVVKTSMSDEAPESETRLVLDGTESVQQVRDLVERAVARERADLSGADDRLVELFANWPRPVLTAISRTIALLDDHAALPGRLMDAIPLYTSVYLVNAGSLGIDAPFHHLYETGTASVFVSVGRAAPVPVVDAGGRVVARRCLDVVYTLDERASDGFYFARTAEVFRRLVATPSLLARTDVTIDEVLAGWPDGT